MRAGFPEPLLQYIQEFYARSTTRLRVGGSYSVPIQVSQGVKQGDPLSCILFNLVIDWALSNLDPHLGFDLDGIKVNHLAFADDVVLVSATKKGLQRQIDSFTNHLAGSGLTANASKCASLAIVVNGKTKKWVCDPNPAMKVAGHFISAMKITDTYKYLGILISASGSVPKAEKTLNDALKNITRAPLKPQQRLWILKNKVIPAILHQLVLSDGTRGFLGHLDRSIRAAVRRWTKLPKDTPIAFFYANAKDGGLGLKAYEFMIPALKTRRMINLQASEDLLVQKIVCTQSFTQQLKKWSKPVRFRGHLMTTSSLSRAAWSAELYKSVDGRGLQHASLVPYVHGWVTSGTDLLSGAKFSAALAVRAATLPTRLRASRGRPDANKCCDHCGPGVWESLGHVLNVCPRTHGVRINRHNRVLAEAQKMFEKSGYKTVAEPHFKTTAGLRKPDLLVYADGKPSAILDATVVSDYYTDPNTPHQDKVNYYSRCDEITRGVLATTGIPPTFSSITISYRGCVAPQSAQDLRNLGLSERDLGLLAAITVEQGAVIHRVFNCSTSKARDFRPP